MPIDNNEPPDNNELLEEKSQLRQQMKTQRGEIDAAGAKEAASAVIEQLKPFLASKKRWQIALYHPLHSELDALPLARFLSEQRVRLSLPVIMSRDEPMIFRPWQIDELLVSAVHKIKVPPNKGLSATPELIIVPLLAFDKNGYRLGYGGGYYDRTLAQIRGERRVIAMGLAYDFQEVNSIPVGPHDQHLDYLLTPSGLSKT
ncbi:MAG: 5-formyltetrahydrofolate cyclo-ligase [Hyphomicrobiaceae bacterium]|nr:5-formyltetrahydrofolate cyclo-ligase [Hyphomicrobiaceae bacterium]